MEATLLDKEKIDFSGTFDLERLYKHLYDWLNWRGFGHEEKKYKEKVKGDSKDIEIRWSDEKDYDEYTKIVIETVWLVYGLTDVEAKKDGKPYKLNKANLILNVTAKFVTDKQGVWAKNPTLHFLQTFYEKYLYKNVIEQLKSDVWRLGWEYFNETKRFINVYATELSNVG